MRSVLKLFMRLFIDTVAYQRAMYNRWHTVGIQKMFEFESCDLGKSSLARGISHQLPVE